MKKLLLVTMILGSVAVAPTAHAQWFGYQTDPPKNHAKKPIHRPKPEAKKPEPKKEVAVAKPAPAEPAPDTRVFLPPEALVNPWVVMVGENGSVVSCEQVKGNLRFFGTPRKPMVFEQDCSERGMIGFARDQCKKYIFKEVTDKIETPRSTVAWWNDKGLYHTYTHPVHIYNKKVNIGSTAPGCQ